MSEIKLTKNELRSQQLRLNQLQRYLPTLQLKKAMLQQEVHDARLELQAAQVKLEKSWKDLENLAPLMSQAPSFNPQDLVRLGKVSKHYENIAGVEIPILDEVELEVEAYSLIDSPLWVDALVNQLKEQQRAQVEHEVFFEKLKALEWELRQVSIRVNLFEKVLIPTGKANIKKIKVFLGDQELVAVGRAKVVKAKKSKKQEEVIT